MTDVITAVSIALNNIKAMREIVSIIKQARIPMKKQNYN